MVEPPPNPIKNGGSSEKAITEDVQKFEKPKVAGRDHNYRVFSYK